MTKLEELRGIRNKAQSACIHAVDRSASSARIRVCTYVAANRKYLAALEESKNED